MWHIVLHILELYKWCHAIKLCWSYNLLFFHLKYAFLDLSNGIYHFSLIILNGGIFYWINLLQLSISLMDI